MSFDHKEFARAIGGNVKSMLDPLKAEIAGLKTQIDALKDENAELRSAIPAPLDAADVAKLAADLVPAPAAPEPVDLEAIAVKAAALIPVPKDGRDGVDGKDGADGKDAPPVSEAGIADRVAAQFERRFSDLTLSWERQARDLAVKAIDSMPLPKDGLPAEAIEIDFDGERELTIRVGDTVKSIALPSIIYRDVWREGEYKRFDTVTWNNSLWIAVKDTSEAPGAGKDWRLTARKGRDGKDLRDSASTYDPKKGVKV